MRLSCVWNSSPHRRQFRVINGLFLWYLMEWHVLTHFWEQNSFLIQTVLKIFLHTGHFLVSMGLLADVLLPGRLNRVIFSHPPRESGFRLFPPHFLPHDVSETWFFPFFENFNLDCASNPTSGEIGL